MINDALTLATVPNFRDLGGYPAETGRVRSGLLFRADTLSDIGDSDLAELQRIGVRQVIDLRTAFERESAADRVPAGAEYTVLDVQREHATGGDLASLLADPERAGTELADGGAERFMHAVYRALAGTGDAADAYRGLVERAAYGPLPLVFHCFAGKDRTGWGAVLLLSLLGVGSDAVIADYLASNDRLEAAAARLGGLAESMGLDPALVAPLMDVRVDYLHSAFDEVERSYGGFAGYLADGLGVDAATVAALRERLLEPAE
ncbi:protein-tyrosine phosphatase [Murinocardiopsis flavida]|uniref:Protein-tyrosine phosphatase n=1 Tax=Murinocardiopsis flavida TaxID=645275 RepID=A0A2P8DU02_9ACTN|nr:tyrosine-protein phosphatase [Murinocardiopsis flavida]PSL00697.1 protein-tyrosine phosphatase [Murinocardiopsis flavida]